MASTANNRRVFGQATRGRGNGPTRYQRQHAQGGRGQKQNQIEQTLTEEQELAQRRLAARARRKVEDEALDDLFGVSTFNRSSLEPKKRGWIYNILPTTLTAPDNRSSSDSNGPERAGLELYCLEIDGSTFKTTVLYDPYFYVIADPPRLHNSSRLHNGDDHGIFFETLLSTLVRKYEPIGLKNVTLVRKLDLDAINHLSVEGSKGRHMLKLSFDTVQQLMEVRRDLHPLIEKNNKKDLDRAQFVDYIPQNQIQEHQVDPLFTLIELREYDVPYPVRVCIDLSIRVGAWYTFTPNDNDLGVTLSEQDFETKANPKFLAFDIECTKAPLKFPDANVDSIYMISYMVDGQGYLILSRHIVGKDVGNFEYTPKPSYPGPFIVYNEQTEEQLILRFLDEYQRLRPQIVVTYNGDFFDWPFLEQRCAVYGINLRQKVGVERVNGTDLTDGEYRGRACVHLDAFCWVKRDSYLPQGSQGLKAVTRYKLGYDPVEVDPEDMVKYARERPIHMASYSVSDAVATYYLYEKYVHMFIFSLATIIPMGPEDVLRKGSGTLCEALLMVQACMKDIICPNKQAEPLTKFHQGHLLESETYIGGKVECLETGVFRSDVEYKFDLKPSAFQQLIDNVDRDLTFAIEVEGGIDRNTVTNYDEIRCQIIEQLELLRDRPVRTERPYVYHLDVGAMYPNIILTNRLQPSAIVDDSTCAACDFNQAKNNCKRQMNWVWRGDYNPASKGEYERTKDQLSREKIADGRYFHELEDKEQAALVSIRLKQYSKNAYKKTKVTEEIARTDIVCMRENDFYVDTVRQFRDKRYELKKLTKKWGQKVKSSKDAALRKEAADRALVYDSLQVAHKCILNSFYGYVMRKGARWRSMEMAGIVTKTGADLITQARILVEQIGRPLELDTDGIWCILPQSFPDVFFFRKEDGSKLKLEYPCVMLNADVHDNFTNDQYQTLKGNGKQEYETRSENSIFFEVDGPYRCMVIPSSTEEGKLLKKRYAVFNFDGSLAELKGFELKRRGELELIKTFQSQVFERFLNGSSLVECYDSVAEIANHWLDILDTQGDSLETQELVDLISENRNMSRQLDDYGDQKGTSQTTARRLGEFLGAEIIKDKGLNCKFIIAERPHGAPVTERAIPTAIWKSETAVMKHYLRKWLKSPGMVDEDFNIRNVLDWDYYRDRLGKTIQKIITIPAALQKVPNPVPRIPHPEWLQRTVRRLNDRYQQKRITSMFRKTEKSKNEILSSTVVDIEDIIGRSSKGDSRPVVHMNKRKENVKIENHKESPNIPNRQISKIHSKSGGGAGYMNVKKNNLKVILSRDTFQDWLISKKTEWGFRAKRKRPIPNIRSHDDSGKEKKQRRAIGTMSGYIRDAASSLASFEWHIVEIRELSSSENGFNTSSSGDFVVWVMLGNGSLQKLQVSMPRTIYLNCREKINETASSILTVKLVEKFLPHNKTSNYLYELTMPEHTFQREDWLQKVVCSPKHANTVESFYEMNSPLSLKSVMHLGCICRANPSLKGTIAKYQLSDLKRVEKPLEGEYLHQNLSYKRVVLHERLQNSNRIGFVAVFIQDESVQNPKLFDLTAKCHLWVVKPGSKKGQRNVSTKSCESMFSQLLDQVLQLSISEIDSEYTLLSPDSQCKIQALAFVDEERDAFRGVHDVLNSYSQANNGPTFLLVDSNKDVSQLRKSVPSCNSFPLITVPSPPGITALPAINWEPQAAQLCFEAYLYIGAVSFPKILAYARYGNIPLGNLGTDATVTTYDISFARLLSKSRALLWASERPGCPDVGFASLPLVPGSTTMGIAGEFLSGNKILDSNDIWGDEKETISPSICIPGSYRTICVEIDIHNLAVAALIDTKGILSGAANPLNTGQDPFSTLDGTSPLGDEMSTALSLPLLRTLVQNWLRDASMYNNNVADDLLGHFYRLVATPDAMLNDPALYRVLILLMKSTFNNLLGEFQRLGCTVICASFNRILVSTNKANLTDAREYIDFVISTIYKRLASEDTSSGGLTKLSLQPHNFYSHYIILDEHNFGAILFENRDPKDEDEAQWAFEIDVPVANTEVSQATIVPTVVSGWNIMHYLASEISQEYFRAIIGRFSKDVYRKEVLVHKRIKSKKDVATDPQENESELPPPDQILSYKKKLISKHFSSYLTRALSEILKDGGGAESFPLLPGSYLNLDSPALEFVKSIMTILELDQDVDFEVQILKKSLLTQIGVHEYSQIAKWQNPGAKFILPGVFCAECQESRDVDLCMLPSLDGEGVSAWSCDDCRTPYDAESIERRLVDMIERKCLRYQLQDLRCSKTNTVAKRALTRQSETSQKLKCDVSEKEIIFHMNTLNNLAKYYGLEWLLETTEKLLLAHPGR